MAKVVECSKLDPSSGCQQVIRGNTEQELLQNAALHAQQHGIRQMTPELTQRVKQYIHEE